MGDEILFRERTEGGTLLVTVVALHRFPTFRELYATLPLTACGYLPEEVATASPDDMERYYPLSEQEVVDEWLARKLSASRASSDLYRTFCPSCRRAAVSTDDNDLRRCSECGSVFTFFADKAGEENVWFLKLRR